MKSANNGGILNGSLQMLHVHVFLVAPLGASHMTQPGSDQHEDRVAIREAPHYTSAEAALPVQPLNDIVGSNTGPAFTWKLSVGQILLNTILYFPGSLLKHLGHQLYLGARRD